LIWHNIFNINLASQENKKGEHNWLPHTELFASDFSKSHSLNIEFVPDLLKKIKKYAKKVIYENLCEALSHEYNGKQCGKGDS